MPAVTHRYEAPADVFPSASRDAESPTLPGEPDRFDALSTTFTQPGRHESGDAPFTEPDPFAARGMTLDEPERFDPLDPPAFSSSDQLDPLEPPAPAPAVAAAASPAKPSKAGPRVLLGAAAALVVGAFTLMAVANGLNSDPATPIATPATVAKPRPAAPAARPATAPVTATEPAAAPTLPPAPAPAAVRPTWTSENRQWVWNQKKGIAFELPSANKVATWQRHVVPVLVVRCVSKTVDAFVFIESAAKMEAQDEKHGVQLAFDDEPAIAERWQDSDEHDALFAPNGAAFAERLTRARRLRFGYTPHNAPHAVADFYVEGLAERMALVAAQCAAAKK